MTPNPVIAARLGALWSAAWRTVPSDIERALATGGRALDVGCGVGLACLTLAEAMPSARISGEDPDVVAITRARELARAAGVEGRVRFSVADSTALPRGSYDLVTAQALTARAAHPARVLNAIRNGLTPRGVCILLEPWPSDGSRPMSHADLEAVARHAGFSQVRALAAEPALRLLELRR